MGFTIVVSTVLCLAAFGSLSAHAADPEEIRDFAPPSNNATSRSTGCATSM
ncbi:hypothetical protein Mapa_012099 [Marchantia paleacea]|nr:hypothetical protein Mapa_012099 [Marchantia paleacea]